MQFFRDSMLELIIQTSTNLPPDVRAAMANALKKEDPSTQAGQALAIIGQSIDMSFDDEGPICQDTGFPTFEIKTPVGANQIEMKTHSRRRRRGDQAGEPAAELRGLRHGKKQREQPRSRHARRPL
jgi:tartrate dehydratase alpha subunit/fumarate hydratase class I-like protein